MTVLWRFLCFWCFSPLGVAPLLGWTSGSFVGVNQWLPCWDEPMAPLLGRTKTIFLRLEACRRRFFLAQNSVSKGKTPFPSAGGLPQALFYGQKFHFLIKKCNFFCQKPGSIAKTKFFCTSRVIPLMVYDMSLGTQKSVNLDPSFDRHGNFLSRSKKMCTVYTKHIL